MSQTRIAFVVTATLLSCLAVTPGAASQQLERHPDPEIRARQLAAFKKGGLREAARITGSYLVSVMQPDVEVKQLVDLVRPSVMIVRARVGENRSWIDETGQTVTTQYRVRVTAAEHGNSHVGQDVTVVVPGGRVEFEDGSIAEVRMAGLPLPGPGQEFVMFLEPSRHRLTSQQRAAAQGPVYTPYWYAQGLFLISPKGTLIPYLRPGNPVAKQYANKTPEVLLKDAWALR